jgi:hypothetical protein
MLGLADSPRRGLIILHVSPVERILDSSLNHASIRLSIFPRGPDQRPAVRNGYAAGAAGGGGVLGQGHAFFSCQIF